MADALIFKKRRRLGRNDTLSFMIIAPCVETVYQKNIKKKKIGCQG
jgi:hypothetical protein